MRELITDAWRMCVPRMLHDLPDLPAPTAAAWAAMDSSDWTRLQPMLDPAIDWRLGGQACHAPARPRRRHGLSAEPSATQAPGRSRGLRRADRPLGDEVIGLVGRLVLPGPHQTSPRVRAAGADHRVGVLLA
ncbi:MAG: hypothetical protein V9G19_02095 [Tetrasphaera sp.]